MTTIAQMVRAKPDPYAAAKAVFVNRDAPWDREEIVFYFADGSSLTFQITYSPIDGEAQA